MLIEESIRRQNELRNCLYEMASTCMDETEIRSISIKLKALYTDGFRHNYADFFPLIVEIAKDDNIYSLDYLSENIEAARLMVEKDYIGGEKEFRGLYRPLSKLSDHINLEIGRYSYYSINEQRVKDLEKRNQTLQRDLRTATDELEKAQKTVSSMQTELIAVLSIFAAIVLAFSGSISFLGNTLSGIKEVCLFKTAFFVLLCGLIIFNSIFLMMYIVGKIIGRNIYARCKSENCTCGEDGTPACYGITRIRKRLPYVFWMNAVLLIMVVVDVVLWCLNLNYWHFPF